MSEETKEVEQGVHTYSKEELYIMPTEPKVLQQLEWFKDQKLALMMHWGPYSQAGLVESWALSDQDAEWSRHQIDWGVSNKEFKQQYWDLNKTFNPIRFNPEEWADLAADCGFKYLIFTTKHHDGFCMWDSKYSDYKITAEDCPFHTNRRADICGHVFEAFRSRGMGISAYFSKADWHIPSYWAPDQQRGSFTWRGPSYKPSENPELWEEFVTFTHNQIKELTTEYGKIDILWFDAGWVCEKAGQDIRLGELIDEVRKYQPWILSADRTVGGPYENYVTPEQCIPAKPLSIPWESCITMGTSFSFNYEDTYKSPKELVHMLINVVAKGGNLALNVGPQPDGRLPRGAVAGMKGLGAWLKVNGEGIYGTRICAPYLEGNVAFTQRAGKVYAHYMYDTADQVENVWHIPYTENVTAVRLLGCEEALSFEQTETGICVTCPNLAVRSEKIADVFELTV